MRNNLIQPINDSLYEYLEDESGLRGRADTISFPENEDEIRTVYLQMKQQGVNITIQGGRTGIVGGAVPAGGHIINLSRLNRVKDGLKWVSQESGEIPLLTVGPGITRLELDNEISQLDAAKPLFWPPDPTEPSATVGGIVASGAQGLTTSRYGITLAHVDTIRFMDAEGVFQTVRPNSNTLKAKTAKNPKNHTCINTNIETRIKGYKRNGRLPEYIFTPEGRFGIISEVVLKLRQKPAAMWGVAFFFPEKSGAFKFAEQVKPLLDTPATAAGIAAAEYLDRATIDIVERQKPFITSIKSLPDVEKEAACMVYLEIHGPDEEAIFSIAETVMEEAAACDGDPDKAWAVSGAGEIDRMRAFRHAAPETVNLLLKKTRSKYPEVLKLSTDMSIPACDFGTLVTSYESDLQHEGLKGVVFGHIQDNHLHVNILPADANQYGRGKEVMKKWAKNSLENQGTIITEHGIGILKKELYETLKE